MNTLRQENGKGKSETGQGRGGECSRFRFPFSNFRLFMIFYLFLSVFTCVPALSAQQIQYAVLPGPLGEDVSILNISIQLPDGTTGPRTLIMPRAIPMGYGWQPYDRFVSNVKAFSADDKPLEVKRLDGPRWQIGAAGTKIARIEYQVDIKSMEAEITAMGDSSRSRQGYVFLHGYSILAFLEGMEVQPISLLVRLPQDRHLSRPVFLTMGQERQNMFGNAYASADNYYSLADTQIVIGPEPHHFRRRLSNEAGNASIELATLVFAESRVDAERLAKVTEETFGKVERYFGGAPFLHYTAIFEFLKPLTTRHTLGFSMEHLNSATFCLDASAIPKTEQEWSRMAYNIAHHVAHAWIPKRAYGEGYFPFQWEIPPLIDTIWFSEGFAQYAAMDALADALPAAEGAAYRQGVMERRIRATLREMPAFLKRMPLVELSKLASTLYSEDFRIGRTVFSRGALMAEEMDSFIRKETNGQKRLRDALRYLVAWSAREKRAFRIEELPVIFKAATGVDTRPILEKWLAPMND
jgi:predicted metalloprotease with PDZ domain